MTKEEILDKVAPFVRGSGSNQVYIKEAMDEYAKQAILEFIPWFLSPASMATNNPKELYEQYINRK